MYAIRAKVLKDCTPMCKITQLGADSSSKATDTNAFVRSVVLCSREANVLRRLRDTQKAKIADTIDRAEELQLKNLLEDIDCDQDLAKTLLVRYNVSFLAVFGLRFCQNFVFNALPYV